MLTAILTDGIFAIEHTFPLDLQDLFPDVDAKLKALYSTQDTPRESGFVRSISRMDVFNYNATVGWDIQSALGDALTVEMATNEFTWRALVDSSIYGYVARRYHLDRLSTLDLFRIMMRWFFSRLDPVFATAVDNVMREMNETFIIGVQMRTGGDNWEDAARLPKSIAPVFAQQAVDVCRQHGNGTKCSVFLTSDSVEATINFRDTLKTLDQSIAVHESKGQPVHMDRQRSVGPKEHLKSFIDWVVLSRVDFLVISRSGFGESAAWFHPVPARQVLNDTAIVMDYDTAIGFSASI
jgi:hypothetical protein